MRALLISISLVIAITMMTACGTYPKVVQGTVVSYDTANKTMVIRDESNPGSTVTFSLEGAEVGADALAGDTVRVAFLERGGKLTATRVMNLTRQAELGGRAGKSSGH